MRRVRKLKKPLIEIVDKKPAMATRTVKTGEIAKLRVTKLESHFVKELTKKPVGTSIADFKNLKLYVKQEKGIRAIPITENEMFEYLRDSRKFMARCEREGRL